MAFGYCILDSLARFKIGFVQHSPAQRPIIKTCVRFLIQQMSFLSLITSSTSSNPNLFSTWPLGSLKCLLDFHLRMQISIDTFLRNVIRRACFNFLLDFQSCLSFCYFHSGSGRCSIKHSLFDFRSRWTGVDKEYWGRGGAIVGMFVAVEGVSWFGARDC